MKFPNSLFIYGVLAAVMAVPISANCRPNDTLTKWEKGLVALLSDSRLRAEHIGLSVYSLDRQREVFSHHGDDLLNPASNLKLITAAVALKEFGPAFRYETPILVRGSFDGGVVQGDIVLLGSGDPSLVSETVWLAARELRYRGVNRITGNIICDSSYFDGVHDVESWMGKEGDQAYYAPTNALSVNFNSITIYVYPGKSAGDVAIVRIDPDLPNFRVINDAKTGHGKDQTLVVERQSVSDDLTTDLIRVSGKIPVSVQRARIFRNATQPALYAGNLLKYLLKQNDVEIDGVVKVGTAEKADWKIMSIQSKPLSAIIADLGKYSNNFVAEQLIKTIGAKQSGAPGSTEKGVAVMNSFLSQIGIDTAKLVIDNGSGLSRRTLISPRALTRILAYAKDDFAVSPEYLAALSLGGIDGTLRDRHLGGTISGRLRAKTGSLDRVSCLSGYVRTLNQETLVFALLSNGPASDYQMRHLQENVVERLVRYVPDMTIADVSAASR